MDTFKYQMQRAGVLYHPVLDAILGGIAHPDQHPLSLLRPAILRALWNKPLCEIEAQLDDGALPLLERYVTHPATFPMNRRSYVQ